MSRKRKREESVQDRVLGSVNIQDLPGMNVRELTDLARSAGLSGFSKLNRASLRRLILDHHPRAKRFKLVRCAPTDTVEDLRFRARLLGYEREKGLRVEDAAKDELCDFVYGSRHWDQFGDYSTVPAEGFDVHVSAEDTLADPRGVHRYKDRLIAGGRWVYYLVNRVFADVACDLEIYGNQAQLLARQNRDGEVRVGLKTYHKSHVGRDAVLRAVGHCIDEGKRFIVCPVSFHGPGAHAGMLIYDVNSRTLERWEPHGGESVRHQPGFGYSGEATAKFDSWVVENMLPDGWTYTLPQHPCPLIKPELGPQHYESAGTSGFCWTWSMMYMELRLKNPQWNAQQVNEFMVRRARQLGREGLTLAVHNYFIQIMELVPARPRRQPPRSSYIPERKRGGA